ncbi:MAG: tRNA (adenosine(37)-N6)-threonylcarbamoyltransferase complex ATPase subunit type 1 TsaE [Gammaproteobacteria bacterium]|jgi:tRNA threonylcarbamoyladenosine biosynthesis protein TsaE|nr:tRNA (adenosine(37)-N6)-threonylcarbamoyltransferase complex ATPase subunit type 1 TsaE [Gammaproteobacteria bacterium]MBT7603194.1 tRNA (adenosine(37)-N6)-threonylcarbamoyltransferase complex ATPase subunit type 1 TsaE [Gammaproteobacteria bacterium]
MVFRIKSEKETEIIAKALNRAIELPIVIGIKGELGSGKTVFVRSLIRLYKKNEKVKSPTFSLVEEYKYNKIDITHIDLYRIKKHEKYYLNYSDYISENSLIIIEWVENDEKIMLKSDIIIELNIIEKKQREIKLEGKSSKGKKIIQSIKNVPI